MSRLSKDITLGAAALRVSDLSATGHWLERVLGLTNLGRSRWGSPAGAPLVTLREVPGARPMPRNGRLGLYHYALRLPTRTDLACFLLHLEAIREPWAGSDHLFSEALYLTDPDGLTVEVYADRPRETWIERDGELIGAIDPLDRDGLIVTAGDTKWSGFPAGGDMGHVHFFVGDLAAAERFYVDGLGFEPRTRMLRGALFVAANGYHHHVGLNVWAAGAPVAGPEDAGLDEWSLELHDRDEREALIARARATGIALEEQDGALFATDPWRIRVRLSKR